MKQLGRCLTYRLQRSGEQAVVGGEFGVGQRDAAERDKGECPVGHADAKEAEAVVGGFRFRCR